VHNFTTTVSTLQLFIIRKTAETVTITPLAKLQIYTLYITFRFIHCLSKTIQDWYDILLRF